jgi:putative ABC transport system permease protein
MSEARPPRLAEAWLHARLPEELADAIGGDLHAEYSDRVARSTGSLSSDVWYWGQVARLRAGALRRASQRLTAVQPTHERNRPGRASRRESDIWSRMPMHPNDFKYALRRLLRTPGFTAVAVASLALGIGANTAMFSIVNAVLIRDLPITDREELVEVYMSDSGGFQYAVSSHPDYLDLRANNDVFSNVIGSRTTIARLDIDGAPRVAFGELISWDYFQTLGVPMALGRAFLEEEDRTPGTHPVTILGYRTWVQDFGQDPDVVGTSAYINGRPFTIVGVAPREYTGSMAVLVAGFYLPLMMTDVIMGSEQIERRRSRSMFIKARLLPGITVERANESLLALSASLEEQYPESNESRYMSAIALGDVSIHPAVDRMLTPVAGLLMGVVGLVLLIACANLASFLLARAEDRRKEIAVRLALGAGRTRLVSQLLIETTMLALLGGVAGLILANWTIELMMALQPPLPIPVDFEISLDTTVLMFTGGVSLLAGLMFGLVPALQATNPDIAPTLKNEATGSGTPRTLNLRNVLVVTQVAFSFVLLIGAGLFVRSLQKAQLIDPGFDIGPGAVVWPMPELSGLDTPEAVEAFYDEYEIRLRASPMVTGVALADRLPLGAAVQTGGYVLPGVPSEKPDGDHDIDNAHVNVGYFDAMGVEILSGRSFTRDDLDGERVVIVSDAFVTRYYPGADLVGRAILTPGGTDMRILGIAADTKVRTLGETPRPYVYELQGQQAYFGMQVVVKGEGTSEQLVAVARAALDEVAPNMVLLEDMKTMDEHLALLLFPPRMAALLLSVFGGLALFLAGIGIYGVVSYAVARRTREMGIRMSLGASARDVVKMAITGGMRLVAAGAIVGVLLAGAVTWSISGYLFGISTTDLGTFVAIPMLLCAVAFFAAWFPARRASLVDPVRALRSE